LVVADYRQPMNLLAIRLAIYGASLVLVVLVTIVVVVLAWQRERARVAGLEKWARANDWRFVRHPAVD